MTSVYHRIPCDDAIVESPGVYVMYGYTEGGYDDYTKNCLEIRDLRNNTYRTAAAYSICILYTDSASKFAKYHILHYWEHLTEYNAE